MILLRQQTVFIEGWFSLLIRLDWDALFCSQSPCRKLAGTGRKLVYPISAFLVHSNVSCYLLFVTGNLRVIWSGPDIFIIV